MALARASENSWPGHLKTIVSGLVGSKARTAATVIVLALIIFHFVSLLNVPPPNNDEGWNANRAMAFVETGRAFGSLDAGAFVKYDGYWTYFPWLGTAIHAVFVALLGPTLWAMRLSSLLFGAALLLVVFQIGRVLGDWRSGFLSALILCLSLPFIYSAHLARHDVIVAFFGFAGIALYLTERSEKFGVRAVLSGLVVGLSVDVHLNSLIFIPVLMSLLLFDYRLRILKAPRFWAVILGLLGGAVFFAIMHLIPYPGTWFAVFHLGNGDSRNPPVFSTDPSLWFDSFRTLFELLRLMLIGSGVPLVVALAFSLFKKSPALQIRLVIIFLVLFLSFGALIQNRELHYAILISPAADLIVGTFLVYYLSQNRHRTPLLFGVGAMVSVLVLASAVFDLAVMARSTDEYPSITAHIKSVIPPTSSVIGAQTYWFAIPNQSYYSFGDLVYYRRSQPGSTLQDAFRSLHPDFIIMDANTRHWLTDDPRLAASTGTSTYMLKSDWDAYIQQNASLIDSFETADFGEIQIFRVRRVAGTAPK